MVSVRVSEGFLEGEPVSNEYGGIFFSFKGIPYAQPPIGDLRFKAPQPPTPWNGMRCAKSHGPNSYQYDYFVHHKNVGSEDCLYLNVYSPNLNPSKPLPVMVWIHGGGWVCGSGDDDLYGPEFLIKQDVILVTFNYRLNILGFLCLDTEDIPGNAGMKDQVAALRWVKMNISSFGGDPDNITIFGESAGGWSVGFHLISPMSKGLFKRAIIQSGVALNWWTTSLEPRQRAIAVARKLGFDSDDDKELYEFFKSQPYESFGAVSAPILLADKGADFLDAQIKVVKEKDFGNERFLIDEVIEALRNGIHKGVEVITGYCENEGVLLLSGGELNNILNKYNNFLEAFVPRPLVYEYPVKELLKIGDRIKKFYFKNQTVSTNNLEQLIKFGGTDMFIFAIILWQRMISRKNTAYLYKFSCKSERNVMSKTILGVDKVIGYKPVTCHGDDLAYIFPERVFNHKNMYLESKTFQMIDNVVKLWTNFAKYGNPTPGDDLDVKWLPYTLKGEDYLEIGEELTTATAPEKEEYEFWESIFKEYLPHYVDY